MDISTAFKFRESKAQVVQLTMDQSILTEILVRKMLKLVNLTMGNFNHCSHIINDPPTLDYIDFFTLEI